MHHTLSNQQNMLLHTMEHKQNHFLVRNRNESSFFFLNIVDGANVFVMVNSMKVLQSGPGTHLWFPWMICTVILIGKMDAVTKINIYVYMNSQVQEKGK